jgi:hypothetical protein
MTRFDPAKLHVTFGDGFAPADACADAPLVPRRYTLTHSDATGDLFLTVDAAYDWAALTTWQVRAMADEVVAEWVTAPTDDGSETPELIVHCRAQGGWIWFPVKNRIRMLREYMPLVLEAMRYADRAYLDAHPELDGAPVESRFHYRRGLRGKRGQRPDERLSWGKFGDYAQAGQASPPAL